MNAYQLIELLQGLGNKDMEVVVLHRNSLHSVGIHILRDINDNNILAILADCPYGVEVKASKLKATDFEINKN